MTICSSCHRDMRNGQSCVEMRFADAPDADPIRYGDEPGLQDVFAREGRPFPPRCHDCGVAVGGFHHAFCDMERHPVTGAQALDCERLQLQ